MRYEISDSCRMSFSVSFAMCAGTIDRAHGTGSRLMHCRAALCGNSSGVMFGVVTKLVLIDDHEALRGGLEVMLTRAGLEVVGTAGSMAAGLDLIEHADPDLALVDIGLPDGNGIALTRAMLERRPDVAVVLYTGDADAELLYEGLDS